MRVARYLLCVFVEILTGCPADKRSGEVDERIVESPVTKLTVGMDLADAERVFRDVRLTPLEEDSAIAFDDETSRLIRLGENRNGDALMVVVYLPEIGGSEKIAEIYWHKAWRSEAKMPKAHRKGEFEQLDSIDLQVVELTSPKGVTQGNAPVEPFGE